MEEKRKKHNNSHRSRRRHVGKGGDLDGKRKKRRQERVGSVAAIQIIQRVTRKQGGEHKVFRA